MAILSTSKAKEKIQQFTNWCLQLEGEGYRLYLVTLMFKHMGPANAGAFIRMQRDTGLVMGRILRRYVRNPHSASAKKVVALMIPDLPVPKALKVSAHVSPPNEGAHINGIVAVPPKDGCRKPGLGLKNLVKKLGKAKFTAQTNIEELHVKKITETVPTAVRYVFKQLVRQQVGEEEIWIFPLSESELKDRQHRKYRS